MKLKINQKTIIKTTRIIFLTLKFSSATLTTYFTFYHLLYLTENKTKLSKNKQ